MDTSNRQDVLGVMLGMNKFRPRDLSPADWWLVVNTALDYCRPHFKYLPGFIEMGDLFKDHSGRNFEHENSISPQVFERIIPSSVARTAIYCMDKELRKYLVSVSGLHGFSRRCSVVASDFRYIHKNGGDADGTNYLLEEKIILTQEGKLVLWKAGYIRKNERRSHSESPGSTAWIIKETADQLTVSSITRPILEKMINQRVEVGYEALKTLKSLVIEAVKKVTERLENLEGVRKKIERISDSIGD